jgi:hypothetical protein
MVEQMPNPENAGELTPQEAYQKVWELYENAMVQGGVDQEQEQFRQLFDGLAAGNVNPDEAVKQAQAIVRSRQEYH